MIDKKELRIGNIIMRNWDDRIITIETIGQTEILANYKIPKDALISGGKRATGKENCFVNASYKDLDGVPLTRKVFLDLGFILTKDKGYEYWARNEDTISAYRQEGNGKWQLCINISLNHLCKFDAVIEYVHQLQNFHYFAFGEELKINL